MTIESQCTAALKRLERSLAISVGMHKAASRKRFADARKRADRRAERWVQSVTYERDVERGGWVEHVTYSKKDANAA